MEDQLHRLIDESIKLELYVADLYMVFYNTFKRDADFWWKLANEEKNHAALIKSARQLFASDRDFPKTLLVKNVDTVARFNKRLLSLIDHYKKVPPTREEAFNCALETEDSLPETAYQYAMQTPADSLQMRILQKLNDGNKDHAERICKYMMENGITITYRR